MASIKLTNSSGKGFFGYGDNNTTYGYYNVSFYYSEATRNGKTITVTDAYVRMQNPNAGYTTNTVYVDSVKIEGVSFSCTGSAYGGTSYHDWSTPKDSSTSISNIAADTTSLTVTVTCHRTGQNSGAQTLTGTLTIPTAGGPSASYSSSKTSASLGGSDGKATINVTLSPGDNASISSYKISCQNVSTTTETSISVTGLSNNTYYSCNVSITNNADLTYNGSYRFYLPSHQPSKPVLTGTSHSRVGSTYKTTLSLSSSYDTKRKFKLWTVKYGTTTDYGTSVTSSTAGSAAIESLQPNTTYYYQIQVTDQNDGGADTTTSTSPYLTGSFTTPANKPSSLVMTRNSSTTTSISFTIAATGDTNAPITNYTVYYKKSTATSYTASDRGTSTNLALSSASVDLDYNFYFTATNIAGTTTSSVYTFSTLLTDPTISAPTASDIEPNQITITATGEITPSRVLTYQFSKDNGSTWTTAQSSNSYTWKNLNPRTTYNMKVKVIADAVGVNSIDTNATSTTLAVSTTGFIYINGSPPRKIYYNGQLVEHIYYNSEKLY